MGNKQLRPQQIGAIAYKLKLPDSARIHPVFHVSLLKKAIANYRVEEELPADLGSDTPQVCEPAAVLAADNYWCIGKVSQWKKQIGKRSSIFSQFPLFRLEDKSVLEEGDNVRTPVMDTRPIARPTIWRVYSRRKGAKSKCWGVSERKWVGANLVREGVCGQGVGLCQLMS